MTTFIVASGWWLVASGWWSGVRGQGSGVRGRGNGFHGLVCRVALWICAFDVVLELIAKLAQHGFDEPGGAVGQAANCRAGDDADRVADFQQQFQVAQPSAAGLDSAHHLQRPMGSFAAWSALAATLVGEEAAAVVQQVDHAVGFVEHGDAPCAEPQASNIERGGEVKRRIELGLAHHTGTQTAGNRRLRPPSLPHPAAEFLDQSPHRDPQRRFVAAGPIHVTAEPKKFRTEAAGIAGIARLGRGAHRPEPCHAAIDNMLDARDRLHIIDHGGLAEQAFDGGKRRFDPRPGAFALDALDQARLLTAHVGRGAAVDVHVERIAGIEDVLAQVAGRIALVDGGLHPLAA